MSDDNVRTENTDAAQDNPAAKVEGLDDLAKEGKRLHDAQASAAPGAPGAPGAAAGTVVDQPPTEADVVDMLAAVREMVAPAAEDAGVLPAAKVAEIWNDAALRRIAKPLLTIMQRSGMTFGEAFDKWGPYAMLMAGIIGPGLATWRAIQLKQAQPAAAHATAE